MSDVEMTEIDPDDDFNISDVKGILSGSEEGEINESDSDDASSRKQNQDNGSSKNSPTKYSFQTEGNNSINRSIFDDADLAKMSERANRFGFETDDKKTLEKEKTALYESLAIVSIEDIRHAILDTIHVTGTDKMKTNDIFEYFFAHKPLYLEWVNESSCNVVWTDDNAAAKAMVFYSKEILVHTDDAMDGKVKLGDSVCLSDLPVHPPPGHWRAGAPHPASDSIFLRFANKSDKKISGKEKLKVISKKYEDTLDSDDIHTGLTSESMKSKIKLIKQNMYNLEEEKSKNPWGELCETWGINDSQEVFGVPKSSVTHPPFPPTYSRKIINVKDRIGRTEIRSASRPQLPISLSEHISTARDRNGGNVKMRLGKRSPVVIQVSDSSESEDEELQSSDEEWTSRRKVPRMRMHADDEQEKLNKKRPNLDQYPWENDIDASSITVEVKNEIVRGSPPPTDDSTRKKISRKGVKDDLRSRIGKRRSSYDSDSCDSGSPQRSMSRHSQSATAANVWSRLDTSHSKQLESCSESDSESHRDLRQTLSKTSSKVVSNRPGFNKVDLRSRLGNKSDFRASPLRIEVDNEHYALSDSE